MKMLPVLLLLAAALASPAASAQTVWKLASGYSENAFQTLNLKQFAVDVAAATQGRLVVEVHANNTLARLGDCLMAIVVVSAFSHFSD